MKIIYLTPVDLLVTEKNKDISHITTDSFYNYALSREALHNAHLVIYTDLETSKILKSRFEITKSTLDNLTNIIINL
jgi:hypothetical protein